MATIRFESSLQLDGSCSTPATVSLESSLEFGESPAGRDRLPSSPTRTPSRTRALSRCSSSPSSTFSVSSPKRSYDERLVCMVDASHTLAATRPASSDCWVPPRQPSKLYYRKALPWPLDKFHIEEHPDVAFKAHEEIYKLLPLGDERYRSRSNWHEVVAPGNATLQKKLAHQARAGHPSEATPYFGRSLRREESTKSGSKSLEAWRDSTLYSPIDQRMRGRVKEALTRLKIFE
eukprot:TRINITY_DN35985_c0_g1_i1.p1 TRINITY_DN35985_c0_g1~~TRINITY_DN35985_c0_g1_i1.p1  ORF type:complete len:234 (-),score=47.71 TRINITY_DN35985_c0_g1_i1:62-763(-)